MEVFEKEFLMEFFLDNDSVTTVNRLAIAIADVVNESNDIMNKFNVAVSDEMDSEPGIEASPVQIKSVPRRYKDYFEREVPNFTDDDYEATFRMKRSTVQALIMFLKDIVPSGSFIPLDKKVHVFLMFTVSDLSYNEVGTLFGLHKSTVSHIFHEIGSLLADNRFNFIRWPSVDDQHMTRIKVNSRFKIPNCIGFMDVCRLKGLKRKKQDTVLLQAVCDETLMFIDIFIGEMGKTKKHKVFKDSPLSHEIKNLVEFENHILGDSEYKLQMNLVTPFSSEELLTIEEMKFNEAHWKARSYIDLAFELLREKFTKLKRIEIFKSEYANILIYSTCVLHNFILMHEGNSKVKEETIICDDGVTMNSDIVLTPIEKRQFLCNYINYVDSDIDIAS